MLTGIARTRGVADPRNHEKTKPRTDGVLLLSMRQLRWRRVVGGGGGVGGRAGGGGT